MNNINNVDPTCSIDDEFNLFLSHGLEANYLVTGEALQMLVDHIRYLHILIENCPGNKVSDTDSFYDEK